MEKPNQHQLLEKRNAITQSRIVTTTADKYCLAAAALVGGLVGHVMIGGDGWMPGSATGLLAAGLWKLKKESSSL
jgi:uncharacterized protein YcfJ